MKTKLVLIVMLIAVIACKKNPNAFKVMHYSQTDDNINYKIKVDYPFFSSADLQEINHAIKSSVDSNIFEFKKFILDFEGVSQRTLEYSFKITTNNDKFISLNQTFTWAVPGVERILYQYHNINYNRIDRRFITIDDLFSKNLNFRDSLRKISNEELSLNSFPKVDSAENFDKFYFGNDTLFFNLLLSDQAQYDDYTFAVEKSRLKRLMK